MQWSVVFGRNKLKRQSRFIQQVALIYADWAKLSATLVSQIMDDKSNLDRNTDSCVSAVAGISTDMTDHVSTDLSNDFFWLL